MLGSSLRLINSTEPSEMLRLGGYCLQLRVRVWRWGTVREHTLLVRGNAPPFTPVRDWCDVLRPLSKGDSAEFQRQLSRSERVLFGSCETKLARLIALHCQRYVPGLNQYHLVVRLKNWWRETWRQVDSLDIWTDFGRG